VVIDTYGEWLVVFVICVVVGVAFGAYVAWIVGGRRR
jgi:hypothetical protein